MTTLHPSSSYRYVMCPASAQYEHLPYSFGSPEQATLGNALHEAMKQEVQRSRRVDVPTLALAYGCDEEELEKLFYATRRKLDVVRKYFPHARCEVRLGPLKLNDDFDMVGTPDVFSVPSVKLARLLDYKSGWLGDAESFRYQFMCYGLLLWATYPSIQYVDVVHLPARVSFRKFKDGFHQFFVRLSVEALHQWKERLLDELTRGNYQVGSHCQYCPGQMECPALRGTALALIGDVRKSDEFTVTVTPENVVEVHEAARALSSLLKRVQEAQRAILESWGPQQGKDGRVLGLRDVPVDEWRWSPEAARWLQRHLTREERFAVMSVSKTALERVLADHASYGTKGKHIQEVVSDLRDRGILVRKVTQRIDYLKGKQPTDKSADLLSNLKKR
jgi:hypothetical protein